MKPDLQRFIQPHNTYFQSALSEIKAGTKSSHWMWYIFPQVAGLGFSETSKRYAINSIEEAKEFLNHPQLGKNLLEITSELLKLESNNATRIFGNPDDMKLKSSMTLFSIAAPENPLFQKVLDKFFNGQQDARTTRILNFN